ncbi:e3 ubiquitin ligase ARI7 [Fusarium mundagurra]|uniref:RBR-type E3 ubiquitin transferase n=1 Tax=Fusarium mundagurra TaxID=1567541 RepID=A0A8H5Z0W4_9HYPO|nr:e3 ubiquitin ligase ARI7 [Fusarium mundagurra]
MPSFQQIQSDTYAGESQIPHPIHAIAKHTPRISEFPWMECDDDDPSDGSISTEYITDSPANDFGQMQQQIKDLQGTINDLLNENKTLKLQLSTKIEESITMLQKICKMNIDIQSSLNEKKAMADELDKLRAQSVGYPLGVLGTTPRSIWIKKLLSRSQSIYDNQNAMQGDELCDPEIQNVASDVKSPLDSILNADEARCLSDSFEECFDEQDLDSISLRHCSVCHKMRFEQANPNSSYPFVDEFSQRLRRPITCSASVCLVCYLGSVVRSIQQLPQSWWEISGSTVLMPCPCGVCSGDISFQDRGTLRRLLGLANVKDAGEILRIYDTAQNLVSVLYSLDPQPTLKERQVAKRLHQHLTSNGIMKPLFGLGISQLHTLEKVASHDVKSRLVRRLELNGPDEVLRVPVFTQLLQREQSPVECSICTEPIYDLPGEAINKWDTICGDYDGDWKWKFLRFPHKLDQMCSHTIDFCTECLENYIEAQLDHHGRAGCHLLTCPSVDCGRRLAYDEVKLYARQETFSRYDEYLKLEALSKLPSFRWCLAENCSNGQIHDLIESNHVSCKECGYEMCFQHQVKWHNDLTCEEFDSMQENGDPRFRETQDWVNANTKQCPSCGVNTQKGPGCFHMTCTLCRHEFCWECLASWSDIMPRSRQYNQSAHRDGCYFKSSNQQPTQVTGEHIPVR